MKINVLGTEYSLLEVPKRDDPSLANNDGYCDTSVKYESGLDTCCEWVCEEMVDWMSIQFPKLQRAFEEVGCL